MASVTTPSAEAEEIQRSMHEVRAELRDDMKELVVNAHQMADWTKYVRAYPWLCAGAALAAGYLLVPQRAVVVRPDADGLIELAKRHKLVVKMDEAAPTKKGAGLLGQIISVAAAALLHGGLKFVSHELAQAVSAANSPQASGNGRAGARHE
jgi:hypothetical protein